MTFTFTLILWPGPSLVGMRGVWDCPLRSEDVALVAAAAAASTRFVGPILPFS